MLSLIRRRSLMIRSPRRADRPKTFKPWMEQLEDRCVPAVDPILEWNAVMLQATVVDHSGLADPSQGGPTRTSRAFAIVSVAMFDAYNSIARRFDPYLTQAPNSTNASIDAAVAQAAHDTLAALYPNQVAAFDAALTQTLARVPNGIRENRGRDVGRFVAQRILLARSNDGSQVDPPYIPTSQPGNHNVDPFHPNQGFLTPGWGDVTPFALLPDVDAFPAPPPPALTSLEYTNAFNQVKSLGSLTSTTRTLDQTYIGLYWGYDGSPSLGVPPRLYNQIARTVAEQQDNTVAENARLFALLNIAQADAGIQCWDAKYTYDFWRPILAIRRAAEDGNPDTVPDPDWVYLGAPRTNPFPGDYSATSPFPANFTPPFPAYTSGHATFGASALKTLANFYRTDNIGFTFISDELNGVNRDQDGSVRPIVPRTFQTFSQANAENGASRIFLGIHWRFDQVLGAISGNTIANFVYDNYLQRRTGAHQDPIADPPIEAQIDDYLEGGDGILDGPASQVAGDSGMDANLIDNLTSGDADLPPLYETDPANAPPADAGNGGEVVSDGSDGLTDNGQGQVPDTGEENENLVQDIVFGSDDLIETLGELG